MTAGKDYGMLERFYPDEYVDSAYGIDYEKLYRSEEHTS